MKPLVFVAAFCTAICATPLLAAEEAHDALKQRVVALARSVGPDDYAFTRTARVEQSEGAEKTTRIMEERFDPRKPAAQRWTLVSIDGRAPTEAELTSHRKEAPKRRVSSYGRVADYFAAPSTTAAGANGRTVFRFTALPKESLVLNDADLSSSAIAEANVDLNAAVPFVEQVRFTLTKPARVKLVAKVEKMETTTRYRMLPDGKPVPVEQVSDMTGSMLGKSGRIRTVLTYGDHQRAR
jgi:hypothetical protein